jgi:hypothetical protein
MAENYSTNEWEDDRESMGDNPEPVSFIAQAVFEYQRHHLYLTTAQVEEAEAYFARHIDYDDKRDSGDIEWAVGGAEKCGTKLIRDFGERIAPAKA